MIGNVSFSAASGWKWKSKREIWQVGWSLYFYLGPVHLGYKPQIAYPTTGCPSYPGLGNCKCQGQRFWGIGRGNALLCKKTLEKIASQRLFLWQLSFPKLRNWFSFLFFFFHSIKKSKLPLCECSTVWARLAVVVWTQLAPKHQTATCSLLYILGWGEEKRWK